MELIKKWQYDVTKPSAVNFENFLVLVWMEVCGFDVRKEGEKINPTAFAIPNWQWQDMVATLMQSVPEDVRAGYAMSWVNYAPSAFAPEDN
jgi:hypothetical protein